MFESLIRAREEEATKIMETIGLSGPRVGLADIGGPIGLNFSGGRDKRPKVRNLHKHRSNAQVNKKRKRALTKKSKRKNRG